MQTIPTPSGELRPSFDRSARYVVVVSSLRRSARSRRNFWAVLTTSGLPVAHVGNLDDVDAAIAAFERAGGAA